MSILESYLFSFGLFGTFFSMILYIIFGQLTVKRLRKERALKNSLGLELVSGWDIINTAQALSLPKSWCKKLEGGPLGSLYANANLLHKHTTALDKIIGALFYWTLTFSGISMISLVTLDWLGVL